MLRIYLAPALSLLLLCTLYAEPTLDSNIIESNLLESFADSSEPSTQEAFIRPNNSTEQILHLQNITPESTLSSTLYVGQKDPYHLSRAVFQ